MDAIKIGWLGSALDGPGGGYDKIHRMAFDEAIEQGLLDRPVEIRAASGKRAVAGFGQERHLRAALDELGWDPPRIMTTAFMFYLMGFDKFEGWVGIDQFDPTNSAGTGLS